MRPEIDDGAEFPDRSPWRSTLSGWQERYPLAYEPSAEGDLL